MNQTQVLQEKPLDTDQWQKLYDRHQRQPVGDIGRFGAIARSHFSRLGKITNPDSTRISAALRA